LQGAVVALDRADAADPTADHAADTVWVVGQLAVPSGLGERLVARGDGELGEAVSAPGLLARHEVGGLEVRARALPAFDAGCPCAPALVQRAGADPERGHRAQPGDHDLPHHAARAAT
jgi:predicted RNA-binding Zn ribbon-like protein